MNSNEINDKVKNISKIMSLKSIINVVGSENVKKNWKCKCQKKFILFRL